MVKNSKTFKEDLLEVRRFLAKRRKITYLAGTLNVSRNTVQEALSVENESDLTGRKIDVVIAARALKTELEEKLGL